MKLHRSLAPLAPGACLLFVSTALTLVLGSTSRLYAQSDDILDESLTPTSSGYELKWNGVSGYTFFVQYSSDLNTWTYLPFVASGVGAPITYSLDLPADTLFVRLVYSDASTSQLPDDFDGDGIRDLTEIYFGLDPVDPSDAPADLDADTDGDGWHDNYELLTLRSPFIPEESQVLTPTPKTSLRVFSPLF